MAKKSGTANRGFASMNEEQQREIAKKGGQAVSGNREHMAEIGKKGGEATQKNNKNAKRRAQESENENVNKSEA